VPFLFAVPASRFPSTSSGQALDFARMTERWPGASLCHFLSVSFGTRLSEAEFMQ